MVIGRRYNKSRRPGHTILQDLEIQAAEAKRIENLYRNERRMRKAYVGLLLGAVTTGDLWDADCANVLIRGGIILTIERLAEVPTDLLAHIPLEEALSDKVMQITAEYHRTRRRLTQRKRGKGRIQVEDED